MSNPLTELPAAHVGPVPFRVAAFDDAVTAVLRAAESQQNTPHTPLENPSRPGIPVHFANAYTIALADTEPDYLEIFTDPESVVFSDGVPVVWAGRRTHPDLDQWQRVYGPDVMTAVLAGSTSDGPRHYLLGGAPDTLVALQAEISRRWPDARVVGAESPPYRALTPAEIEEQDQRIAESGASIVWVGLGTPKQDWEVRRLAGSLPVVAMAVGAAFDFLAGTKPQAPPWMQRSGTEWLYRLGSEPRRLARRYLWGNPRFVHAAWRDRHLDTPTPLRPTPLRHRLIRGPRVIDAAAPPVLEGGIPLPATARKVAFFAHHGEHPTVSRSVSELTGQLVSNGYHVVLMSSSEFAEPLLWPGGLPDGVTVFRRDNIGYDFGSWAAGLALYPQAASAPYVLLVNDSLVGPFAPLDGLLADFEASDADVWALVDTTQEKYHVQSYFVGYRHGVLADPALRKFWDNIRVEPEKLMIVRRYEIGGTQWLLRHGYTIEVAFPYATVVAEGFNPTSFGWRRLLAHGFPFVKREMVLNPPELIPDAGDVGAVVRERFGADVQEWV